MKFGYLCIKSLAMNNTKINLSAIVAHAAQAVKGLRFYYRNHSNEKCFFDKLPSGAYCLSGFGGDAHNRGLLYIQREGALNPLLTETGEHLRFPELGGLTHYNGTWKQ